MEELEKVEARGCNKFFNPSRFYKNNFVHKCNIILARYVSR